MVQDEIARRQNLIALLVLIGLPLTASPPSAMDSIQYTLSFPAPHTHYVEVEAAYPAADRDSVDLMMAVWTPGSYLVRDYSGKVESVRTLEGGEASKISKNRWRIPSDGSDAVRVSYRVYSREMSVRTNWVERDFAVLVGAATFLTAVDPETDRPSRVPHRVRVELPEGWAASHAALPQEYGSYVAADFDELLDSPIVAGDLAVDQFDAADAPHALVHVGDHELFDRDQAVQDFKKLIEANMALWGERPYSRYSMLNAITESGGGLEHKSSALLMTSRWATRSPKSYKRWLKLVSHEYFHAWNVKRMRPKELGPFNYEQETRTPSLWIAEGFTSYYEALLMRRAGLFDDAEFLSSLSDDLQAVQQTPGRLVDPVVEASNDAWVKAYKRHEATANQTVSYYAKGAAIAWILDARIREATRGRKSLDDVLRSAWTRYSGDEGYTDPQFRSLLSETAGVDLSPFLEEALERATELDYGPALAWWGLRFKAPEVKPDEPKSAWLGASFSTNENRTVASQVETATPAFKAGLNVGDELLAIDGYRTPTGDLSSRLALYRPGDELTLLVSRRDRIMELSLTAGEKPAETWELEIDPDSGKKEEKRRAAWMEN